MKKRPFGVWFWTIWVGIGAGLLPPVVLISAYFGLPELLAVVPPLYQAASVLASIGVVFAAVSAWRGLRRGRDLFVAVTCIYYILVAINGVLLSEVAAAEGFEGKLIVRAVRGLVVAAWVAAYFYLAPSARAFYSPAPASNSAPIPEEESPSSPTAE